MTVDSPSKTQLMTARIALVLLIGLALVGAIWHGLSLDVQRRVWGDIFNRPAGPMSLRFALQPLMGFIAALHDGIKDARRGRTPYLWTILTNSEKRGARLQEGLIATSRTILIGLVMDGIYQVVVLKTFYPGEAVLVAILLAFVPYLFLRGTIARIAGRTQANTEARLKEARK